MTKECPTCKDRKKIIVCDDCLTLSCAEGNFFCDNYQGAGFKEVPCPDCAKKKKTPSSKEPQQPKEDKLERIRKICYTANYDNHKYPDERSILVAIHDVIYEDCKDCRRKRDLCPKHKPSREDTGCSCKEIVGTEPKGVSVWQGRREIERDPHCPVHGNPKQDSQPSLDTETPAERTGAGRCIETDSSVTDVLAHYFLPQGEPVHRKAAEKIESLFTARLESLREELKQTWSSEWKSTALRNETIDRIFDRAIDKEKIKHS